jgi:hypothetical protein
MRGVSRGLATLVGAAASGVLIWAATRVAGPSVGDYWGVIGLLAAAGLVLSLSQVAGGWPKGGRPTISLGVLLIGFLPTLIAAGWIILYSQPSANWFQHHFDSWSTDIGVGGLVHEVGRVAMLVAFGLGVVFGFIFDTTGPRTASVPGPRAGAVPAADTAPTRVTRREDTAATRVGRPAEPPTRDRGPKP